MIERCGGAFERDRDHSSIKEGMDGSKCTTIVRRALNLQGL
jgi:hypothetical protein